MFTKIYIISILSLLAVACVTVNVYFPVAAAEKAADKFVGQVYQKSIPKVLNEEIKPKDSSEENIWGTDSPNSSLPWPIKLANIFISSAYAEINIDISSPNIQILQDNMAKRHQKLKRGYEIGAIGITNDGLVTLRNPDKIPLKNLPKIKRWIEEENQERLNLYKEIALENKHPEWESDIKAIFISRWIELAESGWWYQDSKEQWQRKQ
ncbi:MAG TPA: DUF1318 domain-containing protein [Thioploca sp.]|nr:DUF1318 domain-containing protein [Thioploca sp.]